MTGHVYFVRFGGYVKIGWTKNADTRLRAIANTLPEPIEVLGVHAGTRFDEARLHLRFAKQRRQGEWFALTDEISHAAIVGPTDVEEVDIVAKAIERAGSQCALAKVIGCQQTSISAARRFRPSPRTKARIAAYLADAQPSTTEDAA